MKSWVLEPGWRWACIVFCCPPPPPPKPPHSVPRLLDGPRHQHVPRRASPRSDRPRVSDPQVDSTFLGMSVLVSSVWLIEQFMCLCCTARSIKRKDLLRDWPFLEALCWFSWWISLYPASLAKFSPAMLYESWDQVPKVPMPPNHTPSVA